MEVHSNKISVIFISPEAIVELPCDNVAHPEQSSLGRPSDGTAEIMFCARNEVLKWQRKETHSIQTFRVHEIVSQ